jgi:hypothetical protein
MLRKILLSTVAALAALAIGSEAQAQVGQTSYRNLLVNGEAALNNPGTATLTAINTTPTYATDGFAAYSNNASASVVASRSTANLPTGFSAAFGLQRTASNTNTTQACLVQEIETARLLPFAGQNLVLTGYLAAGSAFSAAGAQAQILVQGGTGTDQGLATLLSGWTGASTIVSNQLTPALTTAFQRVGVVFAMPATVTELAVSFCFTPTGTASSTNDVMFLTGAQLEVASVNPGTGQCPAIPVGTAPPAFTQSSVTCGTQYEHKPTDAEVLLTGRYFQGFAETNAVMGTCVVTGSNAQTCSIPLSPPMFKAPTSSITAGGLQMIIDGAAGTALVSAATTTSTTSQCQITSGNTTTVAAHGIALRGSGTTGGIFCAGRF